jgi:hypothetical protein
LGTIVKKSVCPFLPSQAVTNGERRTRREGEARFKNFILLTS